MLMRIVRITFEVSPSGASQDMEVQLADLFLFLMGWSSTRRIRIIASLAQYLGMMAERVQFWDACCTDALLSASVPTGAKRARRLDPLLVDALGKMAGEGVLARSGSAASANMHRFRRFTKKQLANSTANTAAGRRAYVYWQAGQRAFSADRVRVVSMALDGSRMGGRDALFSCLYSPRQEVAVWCPPQAPPHGGTNRQCVSFWSFCVRIFSA